MPVLIPDEVDLNGDVITAEEIEKTAHEFVTNLKDKEINIDHGVENIEEAQIVESYILPVDIDYGDGDPVPKGSWAIGIKLSDELYQKALDGEFIGVSMEGVGIKN